MNEPPDSPPGRNPSIEIMPQRVQALHAGHIVADSDHAVLVREKDGLMVTYFPVDDVDMTQMAPTDYRNTTDLGSARYWTFSRDGKIWENGVWSYDHPAKGAEELQGMVAFHPNIIDLHFVDPDKGQQMWAEEERRMSDYIRHTDSGSGASQQEHWKPTVHNSRG
jgi:uncharacterized protein (DUF427 family)